MSEADAIAGIVSGEVTPWTPARLIEVFCHPALRSSFRADERDEEKREEWHAGFCGYAGRDAYGPGIAGFDDGHTLWGELTQAGWVLVQDPGDSQFPYAFRMVWSKDGVYAMTDYCEGDFGVSVYDDLEALEAGVQAFRDWDANR